jgi:post-segregation antitoxin (ccd killing protein)
MPQQISITLPDDLYGELQKVEARLNVSGTCQQALRAEINRQKLSMKETENMDDIIERLKSDKARYDERYRDRGHEDGLCEARKLSYEEFLEALAAGPRRIDKTNLWDNWLKDEIGGLSRMDPAFNTEVYFDGWVEGVTQFWQKVRDRLKPP